MCLAPDMVQAGSPEKGKIKDFIMRDEQCVVPDEGLHKASVWCATKSDPCRKTRIEHWKHRMDILRLGGMQRKRRSPELRGMALFAADTA